MNEHQKSVERRTLKIEEILATKRAAISHKIRPQIPNPNVASLRMHVLQFVAQTSEYASAEEEPELTPDSQGDRSTLLQLPSSGEERETMKRILADLGKTRLSFGRFTARDVYLCALNAFKA